MCKCSTSLSDVFNTFILQCLFRIMCCFVRAKDDRRYSGRHTHTHTSPALLPFRRSFFSLVNHDILLVIPPVSPDQHKLRIQLCDTTHIHMHLMHTLHKYVHIQMYSYVCAYIHIYIYVCVHTYAFHICF